MCVDVGHSCCCVDGGHVVEHTLVPQPQCHEFSSRSQLDNSFKI